ncbi:MAG: hypothetical protein C0600_00860 [Ignavibacteria bacterium]|nr:MAG: hypothetical protein C0600_00860 [Ignavibacteria bacterium]
MPIVRAGWYQYSGGVQYQDGRDRDWDPLFARWPKWSESFIYSLSQLRDGIAYTSNITAPWVEVRWQPVARVSLRTMLQRLGDHAGRTELLTPSAIGTLLIAEVKFQAMDRLSGHFLFERMWYDDGHPIIEADDYVWMRAELQYRWSDILVQ